MLDPALWVYVWSFSPRKDGHFNDWRPIMSRTSIQWLDKSPSSSSAVFICYHTLMLENNETKAEKHIRKKKKKIEFLEYHLKLPTATPACHLLAGPSWVAIQQHTTLRISLIIRKANDDIIVIQIIYIGWPLMMHLSSKQNICQKSNGQIFLGPTMVSSRCTSMLSLSLWDQEGNPR